MDKLQNARTELIRMLGQAGGNQDARRYSLLSDLLGSLHTWLHDKTPQEFGALEGHDIVMALQDIGINPAATATFRESLTAVKKDNEDAQTGNFGPQQDDCVSSLCVNLVNKVITLLEMLFSEDCRWVNAYRFVLEPLTVGTGYKDNLGFGSRQGVQASLCCLDSSVAFKPLAELVRFQTSRFSRLLFITLFVAWSRCLVLTSGTLSPMDSFQGELGVPFEHKLEARHVINTSSKETSQIWVGVCHQGPLGHRLESNFRSSSKMSLQDDLGESVLACCRCVPQGVLCFFPSYHLLNIMMTRWKATGMLKKLSATKRVCEVNLRETPFSHRETVLWIAFRNRGTAKSLKKA